MTTEELEEAIRYLGKVLEENCLNIIRLEKERDEWKNKYLMKISEPVGK